MPLYFNGSAPTNTCICLDNNELQTYPIESSYSTVYVVLCINSNLWWSELVTPTSNCISLEWP